jgi:hypothetical protein
MAQEGRDTLQAQIDLAPQQYAVNAEYTPKYNALERQSMWDQMFGNNGYLQAYQKLAPELSAMEQQSTQAQRLADVQSIEQLGGRAIAAGRAADPWTTALMDRLNSQATAGLDAGTGLTPAEQRIAQQSARASYAARGMNGSNLSAAGEALNNFLLGSNRQQQNQQFALNVVGANRAVNADPFQVILGRSGNNVNQSIAATQQGTQAGQLGQTQSMFDPFNAYGANLYGQNNASYNDWLSNKPTGAQRVKFGTDAFGSFLGNVAKAAM